MIFLYGDGNIFCTQRRGGLPMLLVLLILTRGVDTFDTQRWWGYSHNLCSEMVESFFALRAGLGTKISFLHVAHTPHAA